MLWFFRQFLKSQIYLTTHDGVIYAFGFPMEH